MRLFSEKVEPTFTSSNLNILTVEDFQEIFFDVFEFEINGKKFIAEKVSKYKGLPVVDVPLVLEGKEFTAQFVLQRGKFEVLFNRDNSTFVGEAVEKGIELDIKYAEKEAEVEEIIFEKKDNILREINLARQSAEKYVEKLKQQKIDEAAQYIDERKKALDNEINESKKGLLDEFLSLVENVKGEFFEFNEKEKEKLSTFIEESISELAYQLVESIEEKQNVSEKRFSVQLDELATNILSGVLLKEINSNNDKSIKDINERFAFITSNLKTLLRTEKDQIDENVNIKLTEFNDAIVSLERANIELNDLINRGDNRALSRIGNIKTQLEESLISAKAELADIINEADNKITEDILDKINITESNVTDFCNTRIETAENKIKNFYDEKIALVEEKVVDLTAENKQYFVNLINESKLSLLNEISNIKVDVPNIVVERSNGKQEVDLKGIKSELEKIIGTRFSNELQSLKRLIEMSSGGGSVAKQFAAGGTMEGTLNVTGQILSAGVDLFNIFTGGGEGGPVDRLVSSSYQAVLCSNGDLTLPGAIATASNSKLDLVGFGPNTAYLTTTPDDSTALFMGAFGAELRANTYASITTNTGDTSRLWEFGADGGLKFPDNTTQTTAFTGNPDSSNWDNTYTSVQSNSGAWNNAYNTGTVYQSNSASYATINFTNSKFFPLTGGIISGATVINNNLTVNGNLTATGTTTFNNTVFSTTSALSVVHVGAGPAMWVGNNGTGDIASFYDIDTGVEVLHVGGDNGTFPNVGIKTSTPNKTLTVSGEISATSDITTSGKIYIQNDGSSDQWQSAYTTTQSNSGNWVYTISDQTIAGNKTFSNNVVLNGQVTAPNQTEASDTSVMTSGLVRSKLVNPGNRIDYTHWFGIAGAGAFTNVGVAPNITFVPINKTKFQGAWSVGSSTRVGSNASGAGIRLGGNAFTGSSPLILSNVDAFTIKTRVSRPFPTGNPAFGFILGAANNTALWSSNSLGMYYVPQPTAVWPATSTVLVANSRINVNGVVFAVSATGTTGASQPAWNYTIDSPTVDGTVIWRNLGPHTSNMWALAIGSTDARTLTGTLLSSFNVGWNANARDIILTIDYAGSVSSPFIFNFTIQNATTAVTINHRGSTSLFVTPTYISRPDGNDTSLGTEIVGVTYFSFSGLIDSTLN
jgi:hypothetical protein